ncbi:MAG: WbqC family protein [Marivibrio sp.]|uniref:WbqC family protein n=1 Tax=Marivibrio sp. TaxID=2039719 RepID=UPI0032EEC6D9
MTAVVAIHQPNYFPWLGYFDKIRQCDFFVFLDDVQFSKGSYTNRVQIAGEAGPRWMTIPLQAAHGSKICELRPAVDDWHSRHLSLLKNTYKNRPHFKEVFRTIEKLMEACASESGDLAAINMTLVQQISERLGLSAQFDRSSRFDLMSAADDRLVEIVRRIAPNGVYLSGKGGGSYQDEAKFKAAGLTLTYSRFSAGRYAQPHAALYGLSVLDALFNVGWDATSRLLKGGSVA